MDGQKDKRGLFDLYLVPNRKVNPGNVAFNDGLTERTGNVKLERGCKIEEQRKWKVGWREMKDGMSG